MKRLNKIVYFKTFIIAVSFFVCIYLYHFTISLTIFMPVSKRWLQLPPLQARHTHCLVCADLRPIYSCG